MDDQKRKRITKADRLQVFNKYGGHCAYCGREMEIKEMQVDHMVPLRAGGADEMWNYMPTCRRCNHYKRGNSLEGWRKMIERIPEKLKRDSYIYRVGLDFGIVDGHEKRVVFYFEQEGNIKHDLKILPQHMDYVLKGNKTFELRKNDRDFQVGDLFVLREWENGTYTGRYFIQSIGYILKDCPEYGLMDGYCIFGW